MSQLLQQLQEVNKNTSGEYLDDPEPAQKIAIRLLIFTCLPGVNITRVCKVQNNYLEAMYELKKAEYKSRYGSVTEKLLLHATSEFNVMSIIKDNLDWRRVCRSKYGKGVSFSNDADYANYYSNSGNGEARAFIVANVLMNNMCVGHSHLTVPSVGNDTAISANGKVYVKFDDHEFLPLYVVYYTAPNRVTSKWYRGGFRRRFFV